MAEPDKGLAAVVTEAQARFKQCEDWEGTPRKRFVDDLKFAEADSDNQWQWPAGIYKDRNQEEKPCLTINKARQHNLHIINDAKKNKPGIKVRATGNGATFEAAKVWEGLIRHIEQQSNASTAYDTATGFQVKAGIGYWRIATDYAGDHTFDQEIFIRRIIDPLCVYLDPDAKEADKSDARFGFIFDDIPKDQFIKDHPKYKNAVPSAALGNNSPSMWVTEDHVRVCEYFRAVQEQDELFSTEHGLIRKSGLKADLLQSVIDNPSTKRRTILDTKIEWFLIVGDQVVEQNVWMGKYIPIIPLIGEETIIEGKLDRKGHTRAMIDPQRMYNYWTALSLDTPLPTPAGWTTMGEVQEGDLLFNEHGEPCRVLGLSPIFFDRKCYKITFDDGSWIIADEDHKWHVEERGKRKTKTWDWQDKDITTKDFVPGKHFICSTAPLNLEEDYSLPIHPYLLGAWLGDGDTAQPVITAGKDDIEAMRANIMALGYDVGPARMDASFSAGRFAIYGLREKFRELGLLGDKHIPTSYLRASREQRFALLQGLMDTDGAFQVVNSQCNYTTTCNAIAAGLSELLRSLGIKSKWLRRHGSKNRLFPNGRYYDTQDFWHFSFTADPDEQVFRLGRKRALQGKPRQTHWRRTKRYGIESVKEELSVPVRCLAIDTPSHLYLAGSAMIPTHNSAAVEQVALQSKVPWVAPVQAIEGLETYWDSANRVNYSVLPYNGVDDAGQPIAPPFKPQPPVMAQAYIQGMQIAGAEIMATSGQYQAQMGEQGNERSARAIMARQQTGDTSTYHFVDNLAIAIRYTGRQILDLIPKIYDTKRVMTILQEDGTDFEIELDPQAKEAFVKHRMHDQETVRRVLNPNLGKYEVIADVGPQYSTRREEAFEAFKLILTQAPQLANLLGDILFRAGDFPLADEAAARLKRMVPKVALGEGPSMAEQQLGQQLQQLKQLLASTIEELAQEKIKLRGAQASQQVGEYNAITARLKVLGEKDMSEQEVKSLVQEVIMDALGLNISESQASGLPIAGATAGAPERSPFEAPVPGARMGQNGEWYMPSPEDSTRYTPVR